MVTEGLAYQVERITSLWAELEPLATAHQAEVNHGRRSLKLNQAGYAASEAQGSHHFVTARASGQIIGYCSTFLCPSPHDGLLEAHEDAIYVLPEHRGWIGTELERWTDDRLADAGCARYYRERVIDPENTDRALRRGPIGYSPYSVLFVRDLRPVLQRIRQHEAVA